MVQAAENGFGNQNCILNSSFRRLFRQNRSLAVDSLMCPDSIVIVMDILAEQAFQMLLVKWDDMVKQILTQDADCPLTDAVFPRGMVTDFLGFDL